MADESDFKLSYDARRWLETERTAGDELIGRETFNGITIRDGVLDGDSYRLLKDFCIPIGLRYFRRSFWCENSPEILPWSRLFSHFARVLHLPIVEGVEWWVRRRPIAEAQPFHVDKDEFKFQRSGEISTPFMSSVFYMDDQGGPTLLLPSAEARVDFAPLDACNMLAVAVRENRLLGFEGHLTHAVYGRSAAGLRTTLLMNWWCKTPMGMREDVDLEYPKLSLSTPKDALPSVYTGVVFSPSTFA